MAGPPAQPAPPSDPPQQQQTPPAADPNQQPLVLHPQPPSGEQPQCSRIAPAALQRASS